MSVIYLIGSLRNPRIIEISKLLTSSGNEIFSDWFAAGEIADDSWKMYEKALGRTFKEALKGYAAQHVFQFDMKHLTRADVGVLVLPAGKSGHLELGYLIGQGKPAYILLDGKNEDRWDVMYNFADDVFYDVEELVKCLSG